MRPLPIISALGILISGSGCTSVASDTAERSARSEATATCPTTTETDNVAIARVFHEEAINQRNVAALQDILHPEVVHHAAGGYRDFMSADDVAAMMAEFPAAFSDLRIEIDFMVAEDEFVVESLHGDRNPGRTAPGSAAFRPPGDLDGNQHFSDRMRADCRDLVRGRCTEPTRAAPGAPCTRLLKDGVRRIPGPSSGTSGEAALSAQGAGIGSNSR